MEAPSFKFYWIGGTTKYLIALKKWIGNYEKDPLRVVNLLDSQSVRWKHQVWNCFRIGGTTKYMVKFKIIILSPTPNPKWWSIRKFEYKLVALLCGKRGKHILNRLNHLTICCFMILAYLCLSFVFCRNVWQDSKQKLKVWLIWYKIDTCNNDK